MLSHCLAALGFKFNLDGHELSAPAIRLLLVLSIHLFNRHHCACAGMNFNPCANARNAAGAWSFDVVIT
jgi:hypothetical protein